VPPILPGQCCVPARPPQSKKSNGIVLEFAALAPVLVGPSFWATFLEPKEIGALTQVLVKSAKPVFYCSPVRMTVLLPNEIGALTNGFLQALQCARQDGSIIPVGSQRS